jgi:hypothetical protein
MREQDVNQRDAVAQNGAQRGGHLYIFQASDSRVKVGRSANPRERRKTLQQASGLTIATIEIFKDRGHEEQALLLHLRAYRLNGEWHKSSPEFRQALTAYFGERLEWRQPYPDLKKNEGVEKKGLEADEIVERLLEQYRAVAKIPRDERRQFARKQKHEALAAKCRGPSPHTFRQPPSAAR